METEIPSLILTILFSKFDLVAKEIIHSFVESDLPFNEFSDLKTYEPFQNSLQGLSSVSQNYISPVIKALMEWRIQILISNIEKENQDIIETNSQKTNSKKTEKKLKRKTTKTQLKEIETTKQQIMILKETIFSLACLSILERSEPKEENAIFNQFINLVVESLKKILTNFETAHPTSTTEPSNVNFLIETLGKTLGIMSRCFPQGALNLFISFIEDKKENLDIIFEIIKFIEFDIEKQPKIDLIVDFLQKFMSFYSKTKGHFKKRVCRSLSPALAKVIDIYHNKNELDFNNWDDTISKFYILVKSRSKKSHEQIPSLRFMTSSLSCSNIKFFNENHKTLLEQLYKLLLSKNGKKDAVECLTLILKVILKLKGDRSFSQTKIIVSQVFSFGRKDNLLFQENLGDSICEMTNVIGDWNTLFLVQDILSELMKSDSYDRIFVAARAFVSIVRKFEKDDLKIFYPQNQDFITENLRTATPIFERFMSVLDDEVGGWTHYSKTKSVSEIASKEQMKGIDILKQSVRLIPHILPLPNKVISMLSSYLFHLDSGLAEISYLSMKKIMVNIKVFRYRTLREFLHIIFKIPDNFPSLILQGLTKLNELFNFWIDLFKKEKEEEKQKTKIGAIMVSTPQQISVIDVRKEVNFCVNVDLPIIGLIENMSGFVCPNCDKIHYIFSSDGGADLAKSSLINFLGKVPLDPRVSEICDLDGALVLLDDSSDKNNLSKIVSDAYNSIIKFLVDWSKK
eukprot:Anaeramoba_ignava/a93194_23.p1 GENE.a93194_23~~a93194_23.p1  ORF type:complete len:742 (-),score=248.37 a93194_23:22-2247(-)